MSTLAGAELGCIIPTGKSILLTRGCGGVICPQWDPWAWKFVIFDDYCRSFSALCPLLHQVTFVAEWKMAGCFLKIRQLTQNDIGCRPAKGQVSLCPLPCGLLRHTYRATLRFIPPGACVKTVDSAHRTPYCWGSRARRAMNRTVQSLRWRAAHGVIHVNMFVRVHLG